MSDPLITEKELDDLKEQLTRMLRDRDRLRLLNAAAEKFTFKCEQVKDVISVQHYGDALRTAAINLYPKLVDPENFDIVLACYKYKEDRDDIQNALGL